MSQRKNKKYRLPPPPPGDAENYILVHTKEGPHWRRKRGTLKEARLNKSLQKFAMATRISSPAAKRIKEKLGEFLKSLNTARFIANVGARLTKNYVQTGKWNFTLLDQYDLQPDYPMWEVMQASPMVYIAKGELKVEIRISKTAVRKLNNKVTHYFFELVLLYGNPSKKNALRIESEASPFYPIGSESKNDCRLSMILPVETPWMALLKVSCMEGSKPANHERHYGMKVIKVGG